jgi:hypothetical protein
MRTQDASFKTTEKSTAPLDAAAVFEIKIHTLGQESMRQTTHLNPLSKLKRVELSLHSSIHLHCVVFDSKRSNLPLLDTAQLHLNMYSFIDEQYKSISFRFSALLLLFLFQNNIFQFLELPLLMP